MSGCEIFATKTEVSQLRQTVAILAGQLTTKADKSELETKLDRAERQPIVEASIAGALGQVNPVIASLQALLLVLQNSVSKLAPLIPIVATLLAIAPFLFDLYNKLSALTGKILGVERRIDGHDLQIRQLELINQVLISQIEGLQKIVGAHSRQIEKANAEIQRLNYELVKANLAIEKLNTEVGRANRIASGASQRAAIAIVQANKALAEAIGANARAQEAIDQANSAIYQAREARLLAILAQRSAQDAFDRALMAIDRATKAELAANKAIAEANAATDKANRALAGTTNAQDTATKAQDDIKRLGYEVYDGGITRRWNIRVFEPVITNIQTRVDTQVKPIVVEFGAFERSIKELNEQIAKDFPKLPSFEEQITKNKAEIAALQGKFTEFGVLPASTLSNTVTSLSGTIEGLKAKDRQLATDIGATNTKVNDLERTTANTNTQVQTLTNTQADIQTRAREQERVNTQANTQLQGLSTQIADLPNTLVPGLALAIPAIIVGSPSIRRMLTDTSAAGTCETAQPGGCLGGQFQNLGNQIGNNANNILNGINTGANAAQLLLLRQVDAKLGAQVLGGLSGNLNRIGTFLGDSKFLQIITAAGTLHNAWMLSGNIAQTYLQIVSAIVNVPGMILNPNGERINVEQVFGKAFSVFMTETIGLKAWIDLQLGAKSLNNILNSSANVWNHLQQITNDTQQLCNQARNYTAQLGNALQDEGVISEDNWDYRDSNRNINSPHMGKIQRMADGLQAVDQGLQAINMVTQTFVNIIENGQQIKTNFDTIGTELETANRAAKSLRDAAVENANLPTFDLEDLF